MINFPLVFASTLSCTFVKCRTTKIEHRSNCFFDFQKVLNLYLLFQWSEGLGCFVDNVAESRTFLFQNQAANKRGSRYGKLIHWKGK